ncbi:hypothetical protein [[Flexibacter] sp. ATCC 35208]|uniref:hypothetical protein n=1 Tax=[Flexibacter] sp. ATCC 35208 TaxID=1936242 RepID=UPI0009D57817|nr:hypothetical protein [[Flexibacter] sp. ATCC 35208]OMP75285.1 hypothetical protein BW716_30870 [[Flexibacter] sp. ATCC 35208]
MSNEAVVHSRAGDEFHYRWAARRSLGLIYPYAALKKLVIEGSEENTDAGEYVIDVTEYYEYSEERRICYYQLKHTSVLNDVPFTISDLRRTIEGFAERFIYQEEHPAEMEGVSINFSIITNRPVEESLKAFISQIIADEPVSARFKKTIEKYTKLRNERLRSFCRLLGFEDGEGSFGEQKSQLKAEISQLVTGVVDNAQMDNLIALVRDRVLRDGGTTILREDVLLRFGITSERELYPAPPDWDFMGAIIEREQYSQIRTAIFESERPVIVHAPGGVGKSVFCRYMGDHLPLGSVGISYDCFGAGRYRNRSEPRHRHRDALIQIINELAVKGLCDPLLIQDTSRDEHILQKFLSRIDTVIKALRRECEKALLVIFIDAADNAEMAAQEFNQPCFANELLRENLPDGCKLVMLCRTERISLLKPPHWVSSIVLPPFAEKETQEYLVKHYPNVTPQQGLEFHRLTGGNPRVQANALGFGYTAINELLSSLGPAGTTVDDQIAHQLESAVNRLEYLSAEGSQGSINRICTGLASLQPHIPISVLARAASVPEEAVRSFIADLGRALWLSDSSVQFRDEPTETWFRKRFLAEKAVLEAYINVLEPLAGQFSYVSEVLPLLYLQAGRYEQLIKIAISDDFLPLDNPIDARNIRVYRLQFAFKAALKAKKVPDAIMVAMRAGEEMAGNKRQVRLLFENIDLLIQLQSKEKVHEIALKHLLSGLWEGSENIYSASLLSGIADYRGEASSYLRAAERWLDIYLDEWQKNGKPDYDFDVNNKDLLELAYAYNNLEGFAGCMGFLERIQSNDQVFYTAKLLVERLIDVADFDATMLLLQGCNNKPYLVMAITDELNRIGKFPARVVIENCIDLLLKTKNILEFPEYAIQNHYPNALLSLLEAALYHGLSNDKILHVLNEYIPHKADTRITDNYSDYRLFFFRAVALRSYLTGKDLDLIEIMPEEYKKGHSDYEEQQQAQKVGLMAQGLYPWAHLRCQVIGNSVGNIQEGLDRVDRGFEEVIKRHYRDVDRMSEEVAKQCSDILKFFCRGTEEEIFKIYQRYLHANNHFNQDSRLELTRVVYRNKHLFCIKDDVEHSTYNAISANPDESDDTESYASLYVKLSRAVLVGSKDDAIVYFEEAINKVSRYGDELVNRWEAIVAQADRATFDGPLSDELAYRFIRCAEATGEYVNREKHWDRSYAVVVCARMSPNIAIAALSRWRDRDKGDWTYQLGALVEELVKSNLISSSVGWAMGRFLPGYSFLRFASLLLEREKSPEIRRLILDESVRFLRKDGSPGQDFQQLGILAAKYGIENKELKMVNDFYHLSSNMETVAGRGRNGLNTTTIEELKEVVGSFMFTGDLINDFSDWEIVMDERDMSDRDTFWTVVLEYISENNIIEFITLLFTSDKPDISDISCVLKLASNKYGRKVSFVRKWPALIKELGKKIADELSSFYYVMNITDELGLNDHHIDILKDGIVDGLGAGEEFENAETFFNFSRLAVTKLSAEESEKLVVFALSRFELHIENDFGDGMWDNWLHTTNDVNTCIAGFIWCALGEPVSSVRWMAAHCVRTLIELNVENILDCLIEWMEKCNPGEFGSRGFSFYDLHAKLYLLIAIARASMDHPGIVKKYHATFLKYAMSMPHILIQQFAADIARNIEKAYPGTYNTEVLSAIDEIGKWKSSNNSFDNEDPVDSYWHANGLIKPSIKFSFAHDFDSYWYEPLGEVFGVSQSQVMELAGDVIMHELGWKETIIRDPRGNMRNRYYSSSRGTWHSHGAYPKVDDLRFYLSYHAMLIVAAKLLDKMPVISSEASDSGNEWTDWIATHSLSAKDGRWLSDFKSPVPIKRPLWIEGEASLDTWLEGVTIDDYINAIVNGETGELYLNIHGRWLERGKGREESYSVSTALVSKAGSDSLLLALNTYENPYDYKLPLWQQNTYEIESEGVWLKGWVIDGVDATYLDELDPFAGDIGFPLHSLGNDFTVNNKCVVCDSWSKPARYSDEKADQRGKRLRATIPFLISICEQFECEIIFDVLIRRNQDSSYRSVTDEYIKPKHKLFIFSANGKLRDERTNYQLG